MFKHSFHACRQPLALVLASVLLSACASNPNDLRNPEDAVAAFAETSYQAPQHDLSQGWDAEFKVAEQQVQVSWLAPASTQSNMPLVVYFPGLGEGARAGLQWRRAWAEAGYAVVSIQPVQYGRGIYSSSEAQVGIFRAIAQRAYSEAALKNRITVVQQVLNQLRARSQANDPQLAGVDWQNVAVAGYDLGAQTAAALAGDSMLKEWRPRAVILLSPYIAPGGAAARVDTPLLSVTGPNDEDPFSWVDSAERRQAVWQGNSLPGSYQLIAKSAQHQLFSGSLDQLPGPNGGGGKGPGAGGPPGGGGGEGAKRRPRLDAKGHGQGGQSWFNAQQVANVQSVSTAFLDLSLRHLAEAKVWLSKDAAEAIGSGAILTAR